MMRVSAVSNNRKAEIIHVKKKAKHNYVKNPKASNSYRNRNDLTGLQKIS